MLLPMPFLLMPPVTLLLLMLPAFCVAAHVDVVAAAAVAVMAAFGGATDADALANVAADAADAAAISCPGCGPDWC